MIISMTIVIITMKIKSDVNYSDVFYKKKKFWRWKEIRKYDDDLIDIQEKSFTDDCKNDINLRFALSHDEKFQ